jgi:hypothetical protein
MPPAAPSVVIAAWTLIAVILAVGVVDVYLGLTPGQATVSQYLSILAGHYPILPLALGLILGHLFWPQRVV